MKRIFLMAMIFAALTGFAFALNDSDAYAKEAPASADRQIQKTTGDNCGDPYFISCGDCIEGSTTDMENDYDCNGFLTWGFGGPDVVYELALPAPTNVRILLEGDFFTDLAVGSFCSSATGDICCLGEQNGSVSPSCSTIEEPTAQYDFEFVALAGIYYIWVDAGNSDGNFFLEVLCSGASGNDCADPIEMNCGDSIGGDLASVTYDNQIDAAVYGAGCDLGDGSGPDTWYHIGAVEVNETITATVSENNVYILDGSAGCDSLSCLAAGEETAQYISTGAEDVYIVVDCNSGDAPLSFYLNVKCEYLYEDYTVGDVSGDVTSYFPLEVCRAYYETQYCLPATAIAAAGIVSDFEITSLAWLLDDGEVTESSSNVVSVYLMNTSGTCHDFSEDLGVYPHGTLVAADVSLPATTARAWLVMELDTPFTYNSGDNLLVTICDLTGSGTDSGFIKWVCNSDITNGITNFMSWPDRIDCDLTTADGTAAGLDCIERWATTGISGNAIVPPTPTPTPTPHSGDTDGDGEISPNDSYLALKIYLGMDPPGADAEMADYCPRLYGDGIVDPLDAYAIVKEYLGMPDPCD